MRLPAANVFIHHETLDDAPVEGGLDDEMSDSEDAALRQKVIYKIGKLYSLNSASAYFVH